MSRFEVVAFDVDGTLVVHREGKTVWEVLNRRFVGTDEINRERYGRFRDGSLSYAEWVALDVGGWRDAGATREAMIDALGDLRLVPGAREVLATLGRLGTRRVVLSGTLDLLLDAVLPERPFEEVYANRILFDDDGRISGWIPTPFDMEGKEQALRAISLREGIPLARCAFVGDSANDVWAARAAGFAVAFDPKSPDLEEACDVVVPGPDLRAVLPHIV